MGYTLSQIPTEFDGEGFLRAMLSLDMIAAFPGSAPRLSLMRAK
jgi:hypothetical protein